MHMDLDKPKIQEAKTPRKKLSILLLLFLRNCERNCEFGRWYATYRPHRICTAFGQANLWNSRQLFEEAL